MVQLLGVLLLWAGGLSAASFYAPVHRIRQWAWATYWISLGFVAWIILPTIGGLVVNSDLFGILKRSPSESLLYAYLFGVLWGFGGLMAALALRYLGLGLGNSLCLGVCAIIGTLVPAAMDHKLYDLVSTLSGQTISLGLLVCLVGLIFCGWAGVLKERIKSAASTQENDKEKTGKDEYAFGKGLLFAVFGGIMSSCMAISFKFGQPIAAEAVKSGTMEVFQNIPILPLSLAGGFTTNFIYALIISFKEKSLGDYFLKDKSVLAMNIFWSILSGLMWYGQYFFYGMGETKMGNYKFASWSIFMASIVICASLWGIVLNEWKETDRKTKTILWEGIVILILSICLVGLGNYLK